MSLHVEWIDGEDAFLALAPEWEPLAEHAGYPFMRHEWFRAMWETYRGQIVPAILIARERGELRGVLPLRRRGRALHSLSTEHTPVFSPLAADEDVLEALLEAAVDATPELVLQLPEADPATDILADLSGRRHRGFWAERFILSPVIETHDTWEEYRKTVGRNARKESERRARRLEDIGGVVTPLARPTDLAAEREAGLELEASGWKGAQGTAILSDPVAAAFYRRAAELFDERGSLVFSTIHAEGKLIGFGYNLIDFDRVWTLKAAIDDDYKHVAPGIVATYLDVKRTYELGLEAYELLGDFEPWKERFAQDARQHVIARSYAHRPGPLGRLAYRRYVRPRLKRAYKRLRRR